LSQLQKLARGVYQRIIYAALFTAHPQMEQKRDVVCQVNLSLKKLFLTRTII